MSENYTEQAWYTSCTDKDKEKLEELKEAQERQNNSNSLTLTRSKHSDQSVLAISVVWVGHKLNDSYHKAIIDKHLPRKKKAKDNTKQEHHFYLCSDGEPVNHH